MSDAATAVYLIVSDSFRLSSLMDDVDRGWTEWSCPRKAKPKDIALFYFGQPFSAVMAVAVIASIPKVERGRFNWTRRDTASFCKFRPLWRLDAAVPLVGLSQSRAYLAWLKTLPYRNSRVIPPRIAKLMLRTIYRHNAHLVEPMADGNVPTEARSRRSAKRSLDAANLPEGAVREITAEIRYRNPWLKQSVIQLRGCTCEVCDFDFEQAYGDFGEGYIEIHHLKPLSLRKKPRQTTPLEVMLVCANCHRVLHRNGAMPISPKQLRKRVIRYRKRG
jgi:5-methylcytosine-specific restriction enzyme A